MAAIIDQPEYLRPEDIAANLRVKAQTVRLWIRKGVVINGRKLKLRGVRAGVQWRVHRDEWEAFWREMNPDAPPAPSPSRADSKRAEKELREWLGRGGSG